MAVKELSGFVDDGRGAPLSGIPAVASRLSDGATVATTVTDSDGFWAFSALPTADEYLVTLTDTAGNAVARAPWSGEMRSTWVRDRLDVAGKPVVLDPAAGNALAWSATGLYVPPVGITQADADLRYVNVTGDTMTGLLGLHGATTATTVVQAKLPADTQPRFTMDASGTMRWGPGGTTAPPLDLRYSPAAGLLLGGSPVLTQSDGDVYYLDQAQADGIYVQLLGGDVMDGNLGPTITNAYDLGTTSVRWRKVWATDANLSTALTVASKPVAISPDASNIVEWRANGFYAAAGAVTDIWVNTGGDTMTGSLLVGTTNAYDLGATAARWRKLWAVDADLSGALAVLGAATIGGLLKGTAGLDITGNAVFATSNVSINGTLGATGLTSALGGLDVTGNETLSGSLKLGAATLPAWFANRSVVHLGLAASVSAATGASLIELRENSYIDTSGATNRAIAAAAATLIALSAGSLQVMTAPSVAAGAAQTYTERLRVDTTGVVSVNSRPVAMAGCRVYHNTTQSITANTPTFLAFNSERYDTDAFHDLVTNNGRLTVPAGLGGTYQIVATIAWAALADTTYREVGIAVNGSTFIAFDTRANCSSGTFATVQTVSAQYVLAAGDYVQVRVQQASAGALNVIFGANYTPEFMMQRIG